MCIFAMSRYTISCRDREKNLIITEAAVVPSYYDMPSDSGCSTAIKCCLCGAATEGYNTFRSEQKKKLRRRESHL